MNPVPDTGTSVGDIENPGVNGLTGLEAAGFLDRGFLREGAPADIIVYDLHKLRRVPEVDYEVAWDFPANEWRRVQRAEGYRWIMVNGVVTFRDGQCTNATPGKLLRLKKGEIHVSAT